MEIRESLVRLLITRDEAAPSDDDTDTPFDLRHTAPDESRPIHEGGLVSLRIDIVGSEADVRRAARAIRDVVSGLARSPERSA